MGQMICLRSQHVFFKLEPFPEAPLNLKRNRGAAWQPASALPKSFRARCHV